MAAKKQTSIERFFTKRRKIDDSRSADENAATLLFNLAPNCLNDLPIGAMSHVSTFLAPPSRALFAAALHTLRPADSSVIFPSSPLIGSSITFQEILTQSEQKHIQKILLKIEARYSFNPKWLITLDFGEIGKKHAAELSDNGIQAVLLSIDAVNTVERLILAYCTNITGVGLEPLRNSKIIEQIDLSLAGNRQSPIINPEPSISCDAVLPILHGIISQDECALKHLEFPMKWRQAGEQLLDLFVLQYDELLRSRIDVPCAKCNTALMEEGWMDIDDYDHASQRYTCYDCLKHYCDNRYCSNCRKLLCDDCQAMDWCDNCTNIYCVCCTGGRFKVCNVCESFICRECSYSGQCFGCEKDFCDRDCITVYDCAACGKRFCSDCRGRFWNECEYCHANCCNVCNYLNNGSESSVNNGEYCDKTYCGTCRVGS